MKFRLEPSYAQKDDMLTFLNQGSDVLNVAIKTMPISMHQRTF